MRAWSHHRHELRLGVETLDFETAIAREAERLEGETLRLLRDPGATSGPHEHFSYLARGRYADQLRAWFDAFGRERCLVLFSEEHFAQPETTANQVLAHLGLPPNPPPRDEDVSNRGDGTLPPPDTLRRLREHFAPHNEMLADLLQRTLPWPDD